MADFDGVDANADADADADGDDDDDGIAVVNAFLDTHIIQ